MFNDIKELNYDKLKAIGIDRVDIITGGYPCQPFSVAGRKKAEEDPRHLWPEYFRLIKELQPTWVIGENVSGHVKLGLDTVLSDLESEGYSTRAFSISAAGIGASHQRERIWIIANSNDIGRNDGFNHWKGRQVSHDQERNIQEGEQERGECLDRTGSSSSLLENTRRSSRWEQSTWYQESFRRGSLETSQWSTDTDTTSGPGSRTETMANTSSSQGDVYENDRQHGEEQKEGLSGKRGGISGGNWWEVEPNVGRVADGVPERVDRLKSLGNSIVPQIAYYIASSILRTYE